MRFKTFIFVTRNGCYQFSKFSQEWNTIFLKQLRLISPAYRSRGFTAHRIKEEALATYPITTDWGVRIRIIILNRIQSEHDKLYEEIRNNYPASNDFGAQARVFLVSDRFVVEAEAEALLREVRNGMPATNNWGAMARYMLCEREEFVFKIGRNETEIILNENRAGNPASNYWGAMARAHLVERKFLLADEAAQALKEIKDGHAVTGLAQESYNYPEFVDEDEDFFYIGYEIPNTCNKWSVD